MMENLIGKKFGTLEVLENVPKPEHRKRPGRYYICKCICGKILDKPIHSQDVKKNNPKSCGCLRREIFNGLVINKITILHRIPKPKKYKYKVTFHKAICFCGQEFICIVNNIKNGTTTSCGCLKHLHPGDKFGYLTIIKQDLEKTKLKGNKYYSCLCICGNIDSKLFYSLNNGHTKSCGKCEIGRHCLGFSTIDELKNSIINELYNKFISSNKNTNINKENFIKLILDNCYYCNSSTIFGNKNNNFNKKSKKYFNIDGSFFNNGIDRIIPGFLNGKYEINNVVTCCPKCNYLKLSLNLKIFLNKLSNLNIKLKFINDLNYVKNLIEKFELDKYKLTNKERICIKHNFKKYKKQSIKNNKVFYWVCEECKHELNLHHNTKGKFYSKINYILSKIFPLKKNGRTIIIDKINLFKCGTSKRDLLYNISEIEIAELLIASCCYCGEQSNTNTGYYNGIDRVNNNIDYTPSNCVSCCKWCNSAKMDYSLEEFLAWIKRVKDYNPTLLEKINQDPKFIELL